MASGPQDPSDHRRRVLAHQMKLATGGRPQTPGAEPQLRIPLVGEVRRAEGSAKPKSKKRSVGRIQPKIDGL
jgi:hypothetical protein